MSALDHVRSKVAVARCGTMSSAMDSRVRYWASLAEYDLETAEAMLRTARHL